MKFRVSLHFQNIIRRSPQASPTKNWKIKSAVKEKIRDLSTSLNNLWERIPTKGGGALQQLEVQFFVGEAWGERRIIFWKFKENQNFVFLLCLHVCELLYIVSFVVKSPSGGKNPWKTAPANPRRSLFEKCFKSWFDTVRWWEMSCAFEIFRNYWFRCFLRRVMVIFRQQKNFGPNVRYCVFGYHLGLSSWSEPKRA